MDERCLRSARLGVAPSPGFDMSEVKNLDELAANNTNLSRDARLTIIHAASRITELETALQSTLECLLYWCIKAGIDTDNATPESAIGVARAALRVDHEWHPVSSHVRALEE